MSLLLGTRRRAVLIATVCGVLAAPLAATVVAAPGAPVSSTRSFIVQFAPGANAVEQVRAVVTAGGSVRTVVRHAFRGAVVDLTPAQADALRRSKGVRAVEADAPVRGLSTQPGAPYGLDRIDQRGLPLGGSFDYGTSGRGVTAYVLDSGLLADHADFTGRVAAGFSTISDGRGTTDCNGHGTHVAGTLAGTTHGVAKGATVVPVRVLNCSNTGLTSGIVTALDWVIGQHAAGAPAVLNMSLGGAAASQALDDAVDAAVADGITAVVAAGNSNADACATSPARVFSALTVGATTSTDARASYSNTGRCLDLFAPGSAVTSAWHTGPTATNTISGTSMAAPHVAGAVAALLESAPGLTPAQVASRLLGSATADAVTDPGTGSPNRLLFADPLLVSAGGGTTPPPAEPPAEPSTPTPTAPPAPGAGVLGSLTGTLAAVLALLPR